MAAGAFVAVMGGSPAQILQAAEIGIESVLLIPLLAKDKLKLEYVLCRHSLGLTCDPIEGLVQVPCIERNSLGAVKAVTAAQLALAGDGSHSVSLDEAISVGILSAVDVVWDSNGLTILRILLDALLLGYADNCKGYA